MGLRKPETPTLRRRVPDPDSSALRRCLGLQTSRSPDKTLPYRPVKKRDFPPKPDRQEKGLAF